MLLLVTTKKYHHESEKEKYITKTQIEISVNDLEKFVNHLLLSVVKQEITAYTDVIEIMDSWTGELVFIWKK